MASGLGAGLGGEMLQQILQRHAAEQAQAQQQAIEQQRLAMQQQAAAQDVQIKQAQLQSLQDLRDAQVQANRQSGAEKLASALINAGGGQDVPVDPQTQQRLQQGGLGALIQQRQPTLGSTNISGTPTQLAGGTLQFTSNPGQAGGAFLPGDPQKRMLMNLLNDPSLSPAMRQAIQFKEATGGNAPEGALQPKPTEQPVMEVDPRTGQMRQVGTAPTGAHFVQQPAPQQDHFQLVQGTGPDGKPAMYRVNTQTGQSQIVTPGGGGSLQKPTGPGATTETRLQSAQAVTQTGNDIIALLKNPAVAAQLGPAMSRYNSVADFVGNPPPEFARLAGLIESYALANMGVHGMRSASGAEAIKNTLGLGRHTPESLTAAIEGLNGFAQHLLQNNPSFKPGGSMAPPNETPEQRLKRLLGGG